MFQNASKKKLTCRLSHHIKLIILKIPLSISYKSTRRPSPPNFSSKFVSLGTTLLKKTLNWQVWHQIGVYFWIVNYFWKLRKKLYKVYNNHEYLPYRSWVIWSQNSKIMAKKQISMQCVSQNRTSVSCNHPRLDKNLI